MKKTVLVLTFIFTALISLSQTTWTIPKTEGSARNLTTVSGGFRVPNGIIIGRFVDTTAANLTSAKFHDGSVILVGESLYQRQLSSNRWLIIGNVGGGSSTDTTSLSNRINLKLNASDTAYMLSPYLRSALAAASYATTSHLHNTSDITSGTLPIARGGTGLSAIGTLGQSLQVATGGTALEYVNIPSLINTAINLKLTTSDTATMLSPYPLTSEVRQVVSDSTREFTIGVGLELTNDTLLSLKEVTPGEIGGVTQEQVDLWNSLEPSLGLPSVNGYVLSSGTDGNRSWVAQGGGSTDTTSLSNRINTKQATLVSGTNIKTINGESLLGSTDIVISGGSGVDDNPSIKLLQGLGSLIKAQTFNALEATTATGLVDGTARFIPVYLAKAQTLTGVQYYQTVQGSYIADNNNQVALYTVNASTGVLTRVAISANDGTNIWKQAANVTYKVPFSSTYVAAAGVYYIGLLYNSSEQTTAPTILARTAGTNAAQAALDNTGSLTTSMTLGVQTALGTTYTASGLTTSATNPWVAIY